MYDYVVVGAGLFGAVFANQIATRGQTCLVLDKRDHIAGNCHTPQVNGVLIHAYGPHVFHTNSDDVWRFVNRFATFNSFVNRPKALYGGRLYSLPINMMTLHQLWGVITPQEAEAKLKTVRVPIAKPANLEEWVLAEVGEEIYQTLIYGYTKKQWGREPKELPASIIQRLPIRLNYDDNYYHAKYQGVPVDGYTDMVRRMLDVTGISVRLNEDFDSQSDWRKYARKLLYTGSPDQFFKHDLGALEYRSLRFEHETGTGVKQGMAILNHTEFATPYTRSIEHKFFGSGNESTTVLTREYPLTGHQVARLTIRSAINATSIYLPSIKNDLRAFRMLL